MNTNRTDHLYHLTGQTRVRQTWARRMVLMVEYFFVTAHVRGPRCGDPYPVYGWRDANAVDLAKLVSIGASPISERRVRDYDKPSDTIRSAA